MKTKSYAIIISAVSIILQTAPSCSRSGQKNPDNTSEEIAAVDRNDSDETAIQKLLADWNSTLNNRDERGSREIYGDNVFFYTGYQSGDDCARQRVERASADPTWHQEIISGPDIIDQSDGSKRVEFTKQSDSAKGLHTHRSYVIVQKFGRDWKIVKESDAVTDKNVAKRNVTIPDDAIAGDFDGDGDTEHVWIEAKYDSEGYSTTPLRLCSDNPALGSYTWEKGPMGVMLMNVGQLSGTGKDFLEAIPYGMSSWVEVQTLVSTGGEWKQAIPKFTAWTGNEDYLRVKPAGRPGYVTIIYNDMSDPDNGFENSHKQIPLNHK